MKNSDLLELRRLSTVPRWSVVPTLRAQNVAEHSFHVTNICRWLLRHHESRSVPEFVLTVVTLALDHDKEEALFGDAPGPSKKTDHHKRAKNMDQWHIVIKVADYMEQLLFVMEETAMGNATVASLVSSMEKNAKYYWQHFKLHTDSSLMTFDELMKNLRKHCSPYRHPLMENVNENRNTRS